jgi:predicted glycogen debranching enzyme
MRYAPDSEWLESDGLGGFASGCADGIRRRRYHGLLFAALEPPGDRRALVKGVELWLEGPDGKIELSSQRYRGDVTHPRGHERLSAFEIDPWPSYRYAVGPQLALSQELCMVRGLALVLMRIRAHGAARGVRLHARPLLSGRDFHTLEREDPALRVGLELSEGLLSFALRDPHARLLCASNGHYRHAADWYRAFLYDEERARGLDCEEDLLSPGTFSWPLEAGAEALLAFGLDRPETRDALEPARLEASVRALFERERARRVAFPSRLARAADAYVVERPGGASFIAGYPWFGDWGRDTFIALRGIGLASGRLELTRDVLLAWAGLVSEGMLPNRFADAGEAPEYNAVDASLWYVVVAGELLERAAALLTKHERGRIRRAVLAILTGYMHGTRHGIRLDHDGLIASGAPGLQLTWMDAKLGDWVVTPRTGKPVEVQALWIRALELGARIDADLAPFHAQARASFAAKFWCEARGHLYDVVDADHFPGRMDATLRPNQLFALGALGPALIDQERASRALEAVERELVTPLGLRSLAPGEPGYAGRYQGGPNQRDAVYHQGTVWPWLIGPFVDAWLALHGSEPARLRQAHARFVQPLLDHLAAAGLGHVSEVADGDAPHMPGGCPFQAWSVGELLRIVVRLETAASAAA